MVLMYTYSKVVFHGCFVLKFADAVDHIVIGTVIQEVKTSNIAREVGG